MSEQKIRTKINRHKNKMPYGTWPSEITSDLIVNDSITVNEPRVGTEAIYYIERRPQESGRCVIVRAEIIHATDSDLPEPSHIQKTDMIPEPYSSRSRVHEYGGGSYCLADESVYFVNDKDQDIYHIKADRIERLTTESDCRFADFVYDAKHQRLIAVCEKYGHGDVQNLIVSIDIETGVISSLLEGGDFYASPRLSPSADCLCWQTWNQPNMPWDGNELWLANIDDNGDMVRPALIAGGEEIATSQPKWSADGTLYYVSDDSGWWHLYRQPDRTAKARAEQLTTGEKEFAQPQWVFAQSNYSFIDDDTILCCYQSQGKSILGKLSLTDEPQLRELKTPWQEFDALSSHYEPSLGGSKPSSRKLENHFCFMAASGEAFPQLVSARLCDDTDSLSTTIIQQTCQMTTNIESLSRPQTMVFNNRHQQPVYSNYYPPVNASYTADPDQKPPLIVICHGGPTGQSGIALDPRKQFWTSRGFALLDVNYSGSTGYGRKYRSRLDGKWGQLDVEDCCDAALYAVGQGLADKDKLIIRGSSAGGYSVLAALTFHDVFSAGASYYGISELSSLATDTHKFEARYMDRLIGPYPEDADIYARRSPVNHSDRLNCPIIFFQGKEDRVVPMSQAEKMFEALDARGITVAAQYFDGEQHGFRKASTITQCLDNELAFYQLIFGLKPKAEISFRGDIKLKNVQ